MKKTRKALLSMMLSAAMVIAMLPGVSMVAKADETEKYTVTVQNGTADKTSAAEGETVTITANDNIEFLGWGAMTQDDVNLLADDSEKTTTFTMPARDIFFAAMTRNSGSGGGSGNEGDSQDDSQEYIIDADSTSCTADKSTAKAGAPVTITFAPASQSDSFGQWAIRNVDDYDNAIDVTDVLLDSNKKMTSSTTFTMPAYNIYVKALLATGSGSGSTPQQYTISKAEYCTVTANSESVTSAAAGTEITITADDRTSFSEQFVCWEITDTDTTDEITSTILLGNTANDSSTTFSMPAKNIRVNPRYTLDGGSEPGSGSGQSQTGQEYTLGVAAGCTATIGSQTASGKDVSVPAGTSISIKAADMPSNSNMRFDQWKITENSATGTDITSTILSGDAAKNSTTTFTMPAKNICVMPVFATVSGSGNDNTDAQQEGSNDSILFAVGENGFDIQGKDGNKTIKTTFSNRGYATRMQVGSNSTEFSGFAYGKKYSCEGIEGDVTASLNGNSVAIVYTLENTTNETKSVKIGSYADTQVGDDDDAPVSFTNKGIQMISKDGKYAFVVNPGNADFTTRWYGRCGERSSNVFNNRTDSETFTDDSGVAWSWSVEVPANSTVTRTAILAAGSAESIIEPQSDTNSSTAEINISGETAVKDETPVVPGLDAEATSEGEDVSLNLQIAVEPEATLEASPILNSEPDIKEKVKNQFKDESTVKVDVLNINLRKLVAGIFKENVTSTNTVLEIGIGYDFEGKYDPSLVSKHGDDVRTFATLTARPSAGNYRNGTFFPDVENGKFYIYSSDFSEFVISYSTVEGNAQNRSVIDPNASSGSSSVATNTAPKATPVYRLFNLQKGYHFFTTNLAEKEALVAAGWTDEGVAWYTPTNAGKPVYRLFDKTKVGHIFTADAAQKDACIAAGSTDEGIAWYGLDTGRTVYKITNPKLGRGLYTVNPAEKDALAALGFTVEEADFKVN